MVAFGVTGALSYVFGDQILAHLQQWTGPSLGVIHFASKSEKRLPNQWNSFDEMHRHFENAFIKSEGFGPSRIVRIDEPWTRSVSIEGREYQLENLELIGFLAADGKPTAYRNGGWQARAKDSLDNYETRPLTRIELELTPYLRGGGEAVFHSQEPHAYVLAPLKARTACLACHAGREGDVFGVLSYQLKPAEFILDRASFMMDAPPSLPRAAPADTPR